MAKKKASKKITICDSDSKIIPCTMCNPKKYLKFNYSFISIETSGLKEQDLVKLWERMRWLSREPYINMKYNYQSDKQRWFELIPIEKIGKTIPSTFRELFPSETNECYAVMRVYPAGTPAGTSNPRIIGMIKNTIFYVFYLDWDGKLYKH